jgi:hypothetical protein
MCTFLISLISSLRSSNSFEKERGGIGVCVEGVGFVSSVTGATLERLCGGVGVVEGEE